MSQHRGDALLNLYHQADPGNIRDVCVVWGEDVTNGSYRKVTFWSGEFTCSYRWSGALTLAFNPEKASNNHLIPADPAVAARIGAIHVGDQIRMTGLLVDYTVTRDGQEIFTRRTSLTRGDTGNGACEILYVTDLAVVVAGDHRRADAGAVSPVRRPRAARGARGRLARPAPARGVSPGQRSPWLGLIRYFSPVACLP